MRQADRIVVFAGPSLPPDQWPADPRLVWRPPARAGDALEWDSETCRTVLLVYGLFDAQPSIRHKELLLLLSRGVAVIGAASMGALRAAELDRHGMIGVGRIYRAYATGRWQGDDEVALLHGPQESGWRPLTEPLANVRATLAAAVRRRRFGPSEARRLLALASQTFYQDRTWPGLVAAAAEVGLVLDGDWPGPARVDLKQRDAREALALALSQEVPRPVRPPPPATSFTEDLIRQAPARPPGA